MNEQSIKDEVDEPDHSKTEVKDVLKNDQVSEENISIGVFDSKNHADSSGEVNMEASITSDDVIQAGGFGARDDISSFLPIASDFTDFEASLRDARDYEEPEAATSKPGLGWTEAAESK